MTRRFSPSGTLDGPGAGSDNPGGDAAPDLAGGFQRILTRAGFGGMGKREQMDLLRTPQAFGPAGLRVANDLGGLTADVAGKAVLQTLDAAPAQWPGWAAPSEIDRLTGAVVYLAGPGALPTIAPGGEYTLKLSDIGNVDVTLQKHGGAAVLSFEALVSADTAGFQLAVQQLVQAAVRSQDADLAALLAGNAAFQAGAAFFHSTRANVSASAGAPTPARIDVMRKLLAAQTDSTGGRLNTRAAAIVAPVSVAGVAAQACYEWNAVSQEPLRVVACPELDQYSATAWYLVSHPGALPAATVTFLNGQREPELCQLRKNDAIEVYVRSPFKAALLNPKAAAYNAGA